MIYVSTFEVKIVWLRTIEILTSTTLCSKTDRQRSPSMIANLSVSRKWHPFYFIFPFMQLIFNIISDNGLLKFLEIAFLDSLLYNYYVVHSRTCTPLRLFVLFSVYCPDDLTSPNMLRQCAIATHVHSVYLL